MAQFLESIKKSFKEYYKKGTLVLATNDVQHFVASIFNKKRGYLLASQLFTALAGLITGKLIAVFVVPEQFGLYNLQFAAFTFFFSLLIGPTITFLKSTYQDYLFEVGYRPYITIIGVFSGIALGLFLEF
ncbi:MAG: hypothetical protein U5K69_07655 [Balneolaceae bacterium]|nr:hypothetical protein [Balneolaceae bacterium]